jgi:prepilin-type processing-associated H-X9-DG protein
VLAFTLIEITMVAGIIGGSQGSYAGVLDRAKRATCANNLQQLYQGVYQKDLFDGHLPEISFFSKEPQKDPRSLLNVMGPEFSGVMICPTMPEDIKRTGCTYVFNDTLGGKSFDTIPDRKGTWVLMDMTGSVRSKDNPDQLSGPQPHSGGVNVLYADGHVEWTQTPPRLQAADAKPDAGRAPAAQPAPPPAAPSSPPVQLPQIPSIPRP